MRWFEFGIIQLVCFKLFTLKFSKEFVQAPSCERPKTAQRIMLRLFENNLLFSNYLKTIYCFQITVQLMKNPGNLDTT
jgi:hypothetical protein